MKAVASAAAEVAAIRPVERRSRKVAQKSRIDHMFETLYTSFWKSVLRVFLVFVLTLIYTNITVHLVNSYFSNSIHNSREDQTRSPLATSV